MTLVDLEKAFNGESIIIHNNVRSTRKKIARFTVKKITWEDTTAVELFKKTVKDWKLAAQNTKQHVLLSDTVSMKERYLIEDSLTILHYLSKIDPAAFGKYGKFYIALDKASTIQAVAYGFINSQEFYLNYLCTHPDNLSIAENTKQVRGAATSIMYNIAQEMIANQVEKISLIALSTAIPFYKKIGFKEEFCLSAMESTATKIINIITNKL